MAEADAILAGRFRLFSFHDVAAGFPPEWNRNQLTGETVPAGRHWSELGDFDFGDIKGVWELSRFPWAFALARAYAKTGAERYAEGFWRLFEHWLEVNPPNHGPNWMCGQEATFRLMAAVFARQVCAAAQASTQERLTAYRKFVAATGARIAANIDYALSQSNNHGVSECVGLLTAAAILPGHRCSGAWRERALSCLRRQLADLVYDDGGFAQHSAVYHRVLLHDLLWAVLVLRSAQVQSVVPSGTSNDSQTSAARVSASLSETGKPGEVRPAWLGEAGCRATVFLDALMDQNTGQIPLYGSNDGANILPLADAEFTDFRPVMQAARAVFLGESQRPAGPWDEAVGWLGREMVPGIAKLVRRGSPAREERGDSRLEKGGGEATGALNLPEDGELPVRHPPILARTTKGKDSAKKHFPDAGCLVWEHSGTRLFLRCPTRFKHRPAQADMLHVDLWWKGCPITRDAGTYSYNTQGRFAGSLKEAAVHNSVTIDGAEPLKKMGRFLYLPWPRGEVRADDDATFTASHDSWHERGVAHSRAVRAIESGGFAISDRVKGCGEHRARIHWLLDDLPYEFLPEQRCLILHTAAGAWRIEWSASPEAASVVRADPNSQRGWWSPHYFQVVPALSLALEFAFSAEITVTTRFAPA